MRCNSGVVSRRAWLGRESADALLARADVIGIETRAVVLRCPQSPRGLVGQRDGRLVVALAFGQRQRPLLGAVQRSTALSDAGRRDQGGACAVDQQGSQIGIAMLGDAPEPARTTAGILARCQAQRTGEVATRRESGEVAD